MPRTQQEIDYEIQRYMKNEGLDLQITNAIAYSLESFNYLLGLFLMILYLVISRAAYRFHPQLRILLLFLIFGMFGTAISRLILVPIRLFFGAHSATDPLLKSLDFWAKPLFLSFIMLIDTSIFLIAVERFLAAIFIRTYEKRFISRRPILCTVAFQLSVNIVIDYFLFFFKGDIYSSENKDKIFLSLDDIAIVVMLTNALGVLLLFFAWLRSKKHLKRHDRRLSQSFQCKENLQVVNVILPIYTLFFFTRVMQLVTHLMAAGDRGFGIAVLGAFWLRILMHLYNQTVAIGLMSSALILILLQPPLRDLLLKTIFRPKPSIADPDVVRKERVIRTTETYFQDLQKTWHVES